MKTFLLFMAAVACFAQEPVKPAYYRFDFAVKEIDAGKPSSIKNYSAVGSVRGRSNVMIRSGDKVPITSFQNGKSEGTFFDVGTNIDCSIQLETASEITLTISADISTASADRPPVISQTRWNSNVVVPLKRPTVVFSSESATRKITTQLEVTVTPLQ